MKTLRDVAIGSKAKVVKLHGEGAVKRRIMDMGITKGTEIVVRKVAPLGIRFRLQCSVMSFRSERRRRKALRWNKPPIFSSH